MQIFKFIFFIFHFCVAVKEPQFNRSVSPEFLPYEVYKIGKLWTQALNLQTCSIVQIGDNFCALFLEASEGKSYQEYFLGICQCENLMKWKLCSPELSETRKEDCEFQRNGKFKVSKVHRRLCDLKRIPEIANASCDCSQKLFGKQMLNVVGFPTCYLPSPSKSVCETLDVCGVANCRSEVLTGGVVRVNCNSKCPGKQPFCESLPLSKSAEHVKVTSEWESWSYPKCNVSCGIGKLVSYSKCVDTVTRKEALDCLGPGTRCCEQGMPDCKCEVSHLKNQLILKRTTGSCINQSNCNIEQKPEFN